MNTKMIVKSLGLATVIAMSASAFSSGWDSPRGGWDSPRGGTGDNYRYGQPAPAPVVVPAPAPVVIPAPTVAPVQVLPAPSFHTHAAFQDSIRWMIEVDERQDRQLDRILDGLYGKRLHPFEFRRLMDEQRAIRSQERQALADGIMTRNEFQRLSTALDIAARNIVMELRDRDGRPGFGGWNHYGYNNGWNR